MLLLVGWFWLVEMTNQFDIVDPLAQRSVVWRDHLEDLTLSMTSMVFDDMVEDYAFEDFPSEEETDGLLGSWDFKVERVPIPLIGDDLDLSIALAKLPYETDELMLTRKCSPPPSLNSFEVPAPPLMQWREMFLQMLEFLRTNDSYASSIFSISLKQQAIKVMHVRQESSGSFIRKILQVAGRGGLLELVRAKSILWKCGSKQGRSMSEKNVHLVDDLGFIPKPKERGAVRFFQVGTSCDSSDYLASQILEVELDPPSRQQDWQRVVISFNFTFVDGNAVLSKVATSYGSYDAML